MKTAVNHNSFSAHGGIRDIARGAVLVDKRAPQEKQSPKSRTGILLIVLLLSVLVLFSQHAEEMAAYMSKPVQTVLMENPLLRVNERNVRSVLAAHINKGFLALDVQAIKTELEADPWIDQAMITRVWPDTLSVAITEEVAIARWGEDRLLNQYGAIFKPTVIEDDMALPSLKGPEGTHRRVMEQYQSFSQMLFASGLRVRALELNERGSWTLRMDNDVLVTIGRNDVVERMQRLVKLYDSLFHTQIGQIEAFDLRYNNGISIRNKEVMQGKVASK
ncbi:MAG: cell division protein FtsQ/DivIB [Gammaproteobacteria bacterium]|nr:cell division protein FtsQ/DivIB [Gammaproteobacteria bacterium]MDP2140176.1 cell division protein FtsQ/DivIB [Gammaproteobacteria bacterium]MDP2348052.1 cell division protein FtsQ/DivIB [Gammaproteobacteria bacterium]